MIIAWKTVTFHNVCVRSALIIHISPFNIYHLALPLV